jgi:hypothetical protein
VGRIFEMGVSRVYVHGMSSDGCLTLADVAPRRQDGPLFFLLPPGG